MPPRIDFYVTEDSGEAARLRLACRVAEKAYLARQRVVVFCDDPAVLPRFDEMLWTFGEGSFVPHDTVTREGGECTAPVALTAGPLPGGEWRCAVNTALASPHDILPLDRQTACAADHYVAQPRSVIVLEHIDRQ